MWWFLLVIFTSELNFDIPKDSMPPAGDYWVWRKVEIVGERRYDGLKTYEVIRGWVRVPKKTFWEQFSKVIIAISAVAAAGAGLLPYFFERRKCKH
ncbi:hypothetical protein KAW65_00060 [candidate division WOR-3 bacterium]|nr:hypothetical protein [candidate division WOR-3 bacterium]